MISSNERSIDNISDASNDDNEYKNICHRIQTINIFVNRYEKFI